VGGFGAAERLDSLSVPIEKLTVQTTTEKTTSQDREKRVFRKGEASKNTDLSI
jgi:hypothetical protein